MLATAPATSPATLTFAQPAHAVVSDSINDRLAEAARYAVLSRLMPVLRHDVAGALQPQRMLLMVLQKRLQAVQPDLEALTANVATLTRLAKEGTASCMQALGWVGSSEDPLVSLRSQVDEASVLLGIELSVNGLALVNHITDHAQVVHQSFARGLLLGALLAFCDEHVEGGTLQVSLRTSGEPGAVAGQQLSQLGLHMHMHMHMHLLPGTGARRTGQPDVARKYRLISWADVEALAQSSGTPVDRGDGWLTLGLPEMPPSYAR